MSKKIISASIILAAMLLTVSAGAEVALDALTENQRIADFAVECVYDNEEGKPMGARFTHVPSGFVLDVLSIQSVPQSFVWVNTYPVSDQGEPHTLEHLLLGKGTKGRYVASLEEMSLGSSSAFTMQLRTCYHFHTSAGSDVYFNLFREKLDAMLHPNFTDEEIRREVCNMGITVDPVDNTLSLEEKGTVYNEMVSSFERPWGNLYFELGRMIYGQEHPESYSAGGHPTAIRTMQPEDIRQFHESTHHLNNMGAVVAIPDELSLDECLTRFSTIFADLEPDAKPFAHPDDAYLTVPEARTELFESLRQVSFPHQNENEPGLMVFGWPANINVEAGEAHLFDLMLGNIASGETSNLYRKFINSQTRQLDVGGTGVFGWRGSHGGSPVFIGISNIKSEASTIPMMDSIRTMIVDEFERLASLPDGSEELKEFNERVQNRIISGRRQLRDFLNSPPRFGYRGTGSNWMEHLSHLHAKGGFKRNLALIDELSLAEQAVASETNIWREYITRWGLLDKLPFGVVTLPDPDYLDRSERERKKRIDEYVVDLQAKTGASTAEEAVAIYREAYEVNTAEIDAEAATIKMPEFLDNPPLTLDDQLKFIVEQLPGGGDLVTSRFDNMTGATIGLAFNLYVVPQEDYLYLSALPTLMSDVGVVRDGVPISFEEVREQQRREILNLWASFDVNPRTERVEMIVGAAGSDLDESKKSIQWMEEILFSPDLREENLPRIRDAIDLALGGLRNRMRGSEESWVNDPAAAYRSQDNPLLLTVSSFLTRTHSLHRLRWQLKSTLPAESQEKVNAFVTDVLALKGDELARDQLTTYLNNLVDELTGGATSTEVAGVSFSDDESALLAEIAKDIRQSLADLPDATLAVDFVYLCNQMLSDLAVSPGDALARVAGLMDRIRHRDNVRGYFVGSSDAFTNLRPVVFGLVEKFDDGISTVAEMTRRATINERMLTRYATTSSPTYVGLVNENTRSGVHINSVPCVSFEESDPDKLLTFLSARLYGGGGAHSMFMKTWGAGLAYSNGLRSNEYTGRLSYYAERCPTLAQTMQFVVDQLKNAPHDTALAAYAIAQAFTVVRTGNRYESRASAMAADLADGLTPEKVQRFREGILALRSDPKLYAKLHERMPNTYGQVLPGYGPSGAESKGASYFSIGPESQMESWEGYLKSVEGDVTLHRLYPRDFWLVAQ